MGNDEKVSEKIQIRFWILKMKNNLIEGSLRKKILKKNWLWW